ncbi:MAG: hypothetical protein DI587_37570 [Variovorax paradoxus]|nr:MAG: hypothetical protein DI583_37570 [Variovorax paradoxus]PZQ00076.1 MAG: hypothetical protein DI587_37570 [Variovorax paradoxus]
MPAALEPQLATLADKVPAGGTWSFEIKFDGYRLMARLEAGQAQLLTRGGHDWAARMPSLAAAVRRLGLDGSWLDGEIVVLGANGTPDFNLLQNAFDRLRSETITYFVFDAPFLLGEDLRALPLAVRRMKLRAALDAAGAGEEVRFSEDFPGDAASVLASACTMGLEGIMAKRADAPYTSARTATWLKLKCVRRQEFVVCGWTDRGGEKLAPEVGSLLLGVHEAGQLVYAGSVGTGWSAKTAAALKARLLLLEQKAPPCAGPISAGRWSRRAPGTERWAQPALVAEVRFAEWPRGGQVRHASFVALREDKDVAAVVREDGTASPRGKRR